MILKQISDLQGGAQLIQLNTEINVGEEQPPKSPAVPEGSEVQPVADHPDLLLPGPGRGAAGRAGGAAGGGQGPGCQGL